MPNPIGGGMHSLIGGDGGTQTNISAGAGHTDISKFAAPRLISETVTHNCRSVGVYRSYASWKYKYNYEFANSSPAPAHHATHTR